MIYSKQIITKCCLKGKKYPSDILGILGILDFLNILTLLI